MLAQLGAPRLRDMDEAGITLQVLSVAGRGADLLPPESGPVPARDLNDALAGHVRAHTDRYAGFAHLPLTAPEAAADELERAVRELGFRRALVNGTTEGRLPVAMPTGCWDCRRVAADSITAAAGAPFRIRALGRGPGNSSAIRA